VTACPTAPRGFACTRCGSTGRPSAGRPCARCALTDKLAAALDDGTGRVNPALTPLFDALTAMDKPRSGLIWLQNPKVPQLLGDLATGRIPLTHQALHAVPSWRTAAYLRDLLMACGVLPTIDKQLVHYETWLHRRLADLADADSPHLRLLRQFAVWYQLPRLRAKAATRPLTLSVRQYASDQFTQAQAFLGWLQERDHCLAEATQADLDGWHATHNDHRRRTLRAFLGWAMRTGHLPRLALPPLPVRRAAPITQHRRLELLGQVLSDDHRPLRSRVAACLMLLFAQPATRIVRLTIDDITRAADGGVFIRFGEPPTSVPEPFATLLLQATARRDNLQTATNPGARWLFPGRRAGQPLNVNTLTELVRDLGIPALAGRTAALRQLVLQAPAPVVAQALGYHHNTTTRVATEAGTPWSRYASGDHGRWSPR
jgi:hypothetical protein